MNNDDNRSAKKSPGRSLYKPDANMYAEIRGGDRKGIENIHLGQQMHINALCKYDGQEEGTHVVPQENDLIGNAHVNKK